MTPTPNPTPLAKHNVIKCAQLLDDKGGYSCIVDSESGDIWEARQVLPQVTAALLEALDAFQQIESFDVESDDALWIQKLIKEAQGDIKSILDGEAV